MKMRLQCGCHHSKHVKCLLGRKFGSLTVIRFHSVRTPHAYWVCRCKCKREISVSGSNLKGVHPVQSCGCIRIVHGHHRRSKTSPTYRSWAHMIQRCTNSNFRQWSDYGGRGITVCKWWRGKHGFEHFLTDMGERPRNTTLDRFPDNNSGYSLSNCRWATRREQRSTQRPARKKAA